MNTNQDEATGNPSLDGWLYQCEVSVWAALDLLLVKRLAAAVQLEPASQEDIEAELEAPRVASEIATSATLLVVQAKLRRTGQWTQSSLKSMVEHGTARDSAIKRLANANVRYVLVTSADVNKELQPLLVEDFIEQPEAERLPAEIFGNTLAKEAAGRFSILGLHTEQRIGERIDRILMSPLSVPQPQMEGCRKRLREAAMAGMSQGTLWRRESLEEIIRDCGGAIPSDVTDAYVEPSCWKEIVQQIETRHAVVLVGPSGTGKTTTAKAIEKYLRQRYAGLAVVMAERPADIRSCRNEGPTLFYLDDPWGKYEITKERHSWDVELPDFFHQASSRRMFVVTTRLDIFNEALGNSDAFVRWELRLDAGSYGPAQRAQLYNSRLAQLHGGALQTAALDARPRVLTSLATPFEIDRFFRHLKLGPTSDDKDEATFIDRVLKSTQHDAIEVEVRKLVTQRSSEHWAAVLWGLMAAHRGVDRQELPDIRRRLGKLDSKFGSGLEALIDALVAGGSLRQPGSKLSYAHPRVELGLMSAMKAEPEIVEDTLSALLTVLVSFDDGRAGRGAETAARVYGHILRETRWRQIDSAAEAGIDSWIAHAFNSLDADLPALIGLAALTGSANSLPAEVARWLDTERKNRRKRLYQWSEPEHPEQWYQQVKEHPLTRHICERFITRVLPVESGNYPNAVADGLDKLAGDLGGAWRHAAGKIVEDGYTPNGRVIAYGVMRYAEHRDVVLEAALKVLRSLQSQTNVEADILALEDGHFDEDDYIDYDQPGESATQLCLAYVARLRAEGDWHRLSSSAYLRELIGYWARAVRDTKPTSISKEERIALFDHAVALGEEVMGWDVAQHCWLPEFEPRLRSRLREGHPDVATRRTAVQCALVTVPDVLQDEITFQLQQSVKKSVCELLFDLGQARTRGIWDDLESTYEQFVTGLPTECRQLADLFSEKMGSEPVLSAEALAVASQGALECTGPVQAMLLQAIASRCVILPELASKVVHAPEPGTAMAGLHAAKAAGMWELIETAISHQRADVRCLAFEIMVDSNGGGVAPRWLALASDKSSRVRKALAIALGKNPPEGAQAVLVQLCGDEWVSQSQSYPHEVFPIARAAAEALAHVTRIVKADAARLLEVASLTNDLVLQSRIYIGLAHNADDQARSALAEIAFTKGALPPRVSAMRALTLAGTTVTDDILDPLTAAWLSKAQPELAMWGAAALGSCAALPRIDDVCEKLAASSTHRVLLVAVALGLRERDPVLAQRALKHLPWAHPAHRLLAGAGLLPSEVMDDLGDIEVVNAVLILCDGLVEERPKVTDSVLSH